jgi:hypothetical protein
MAQVALIPDSDHSNDAGWSTAPFFSKIDDGLTHDGTSTTILGASLAESKIRFGLTPMVELLAVQKVTLRYVVDNNGGGAGHRSRAGVRIGTTDFMDPSWRSSSVGSFTTYDFDLPLNPASSAPWTKADLDDLVLVLAVDDPSAGPDTSRITMALAIVTYTPVPVGISDAREKASHLLRERRFPRERVKMKTTLRALDLKLGDDISMVHFAGPAKPRVETSPELVSPGSYGWRMEDWSKRLLRLKRRSIDLNSMTVEMDLEGRNGFLCTFWDSAESRRSSSPIEDGVARLTTGGLVTFTRASKAWLEDPCSGLVTEYAINQKPVTVGGLLLETASENLLLYSSGIDGTGVLPAPTGAGVNGSSVTSEAAPPSPLFADMVGAQVIKLTAGNPMAVDLVQPWPTTASVPSSTRVRFSVDHMDDPGANFRWRLQRGVDGFYWNDSTSSWGAGVTNNVFTASTTRVRDRSKVINVGTSATTLTLSCLQLAGPPNGRLNRIYHLQLEAKHFASSRIVTRAATYTRAACVYKVVNNSGARAFNNTGGTFLCEFVPLYFDPGDPLPGTVAHVFDVQYDANNRWRLYQDHASTALTFAAAVAGVGYGTANSSFLPTRGTLYRLACRWTSAAGELGIPPRSLDVFLNGVKTFTVQRSGDPTPTATSDLFIGTDSTGANAIDGYLRRILFTQEVYTDEQIAGGVA